MICLSSFFASAAFADCEPDPKLGFSSLSVDNQTDFILTLTATSPPYLDKEGYGAFLSTLGSYYKNPGTKSHSIDARKSDEFYSDETVFLNDFGISGELTEKIVITSDEWPKDKMIVVNLNKEIKHGIEITKKEYRGKLDPLMQIHKKEHLEQTPRITWNLEWDDANCVWKMSLKQTETHTGFRPHKKQNN